MLPSRNRRRLHKTSTITLFGDSMIAGDPSKPSQASSSSQSRKWVIRGNVAAKSGSIVIGTCRSKDNFFNWVESPARAEKHSSVHSPSLNESVDKCSSDKVAICPQCLQPARACDVKGL